MIYTVSRHLQSNRLAKNFVKILMTAIKSVNVQNCDMLDQTLDNFLFQHRNSAHTTTRKTPSVLIKGRNLRSSLCFDTTKDHFWRENGLHLCTGVILQNLGNRMFCIIDLQNGTLHRRHANQIRIGSLKTTNSRRKLIPVVNYMNKSFEFKPQTDRAQRQWYHWYHLYADHFISYCGIHLMSAVRFMQ